MRKRAARKIDTSVGRPPDSRRLFHLKLSHQPFGWPVCFRPLALSWRRLQGPAVPVFGRAFFCRAHRALRFVTVGVRFGAAILRRGRSFYLGGWPPCQPRQEMARRSLGHFFAKCAGKQPWTAMSWRDPQSRHRRLPFAPSPALPDWKKFLPKGGDHRARLWALS